MAKKYVFFGAVICLLIFVAAVFVFMPQPSIDQEEKLHSAEKIRIITTLFPQYDFVKQITKDKAVVELLLPPGVESHTYEPSPSDIIKILDLQSKCNAVRRDSM